MRRDVFLVNLSRGNLLDEAALTAVRQWEYEVTKVNGKPASVEVEERTLLAWWRSGLAALAVALGVGRLLPALLDERTADRAATSASGR